MGCRCLKGPLQGQKLSEREMIENLIVLVGDDCWEAAVFPSEEEILETLKGVLKCLTVKNPCYNQTLIK